MKSFLLSILFLPIALGAFSQAHYPVPEKYVLDSLADYVAFEKEAIKCMRIYINEPIPEAEGLSRSRARAFCLLWLAGHPEIRLELQSDAMPFIKEEGELLYIFLFGAGLAYEKGEREMTGLELHKAGINAVIRVADKTKRVRKLKSIKEIVKLKKRGKLDDWIASKIS